PLAASRNRRAHLPAAVAGMTIGGVTSYLFAYVRPTAAERLLTQLPFSREDQVDRVRTRLKHHGAAAFVIQPFSGVPMKTWAVAGGMARVEPWRAIPLFIAAR